MIKTWRGLLIALALAALALACNFPTAGSGPTPGRTQESVTQTSPAPSGPPPEVVIESPDNGSQAVILQPLTVRVRAKDSTGVTRIDMRESGRIVANQPSPDPRQDLTALLVYRPSSLGTVTLEVVAYRQNVASNPASLTIQIVGSAAELKNPGQAKPTVGVAAGAVCTVHPNVSGLSLRAGPGTNYRVLTSAQIGDDLNVIGRNASGTWFQITRNNNTFVGWVSVGYVSMVGDCGKAPITSPTP
jgi:hypothetical protein